MTENTSTTPRKPRIFTWTMDCRFADLDSYGHMNASKYLDIVASSRLLYMERVLKVSIQDVTREGHGFYLLKATQEFLRPVVGLVPLQVVSHVVSIEREIIVVDFKIENPENNKLYARGTLHYAIVNLSDRRSARETPAFLIELLFE